MKGRILSVLVSAMLVTAGAAFAHHGTNISYDGDKVVTVKGKATKYVWANPHSQLFWEAVEDGKTVVWGGELHSIALLTRAGWTRDLIKVGDTLEVTGHPSRAGTPYMVVTRVVLNGKEYFRDLPDTTQGQ